MRRPYRLHFSVRDAGCGFDPTNRPTSDDGHFGLDGVSATSQIRAQLPNTRILILTSFGTSSDISRAIAAGASGVILKDDSTDNQLGAANRTEAVAIALRKHLLKI